MDFHSIEFYVLALFVAFALLGVIFGRSERAPARSHLAAFEMSDDDQERGDDDHWVRFSGQPNGTMLIERQGLMLRPGETLNLVATLIDDKATLVEKPGVALTSGTPGPVRAYVSVDWIPSRRLHIRYESEVTGEWGLVTFTNRETAVRECQLRH